MPRPPVIVVSNRGPVSFSIDEAGELVPRRGAGGLVSGIGPVVAEAGATWIAAALSDGDRVAAGKGTLDASGFRTRLLDVGADDLHLAYDVVSNGTLWFLHHALWDRALRPVFGAPWRQAWAGFRRYNEAFASAVDEEAPEGATVLLQDYHLALVGGMLAGRRPDLRTVHFAHTPFAGPDELAVLPDAAARELVEALAAHTACGFHTRRWASNFEACCAAIGVEVPPAFVSPLPADVDGLAAVATSAACERHLAQLEARLGDRLAVVRVDRIELSKNLVRGFLAFDTLLDQYPEWRGRVTFVAAVYPSRETLPEYVAYREQVEAVVRDINGRWATDDWCPLLVDVDDDFARSVAALRRFDVLMVNPVRDGLNLVAKEGPSVNGRDGVVVLSRQAGVHDELEAAGAADAVLAVNPFDVAATADALHRALAMPAAERRRRAEALRRAVRGRTAGDWLAEQLAAGAGGAR